MKVELQDIVEAFFKAVKENNGTILAFVAAIAAIYCAIDFMASGAGSSVAQIVISIFGQYLLTAKILADRMRPGGQRPAYGSILGASLLSGLGIIVGLIFLILPGIYLMGRYSIVTPVIVVEGKRATEALGVSWSRSEQSLMPLFVTYLIGGAIFVASFLAVGFASGVASASGGGAGQAIDIVKVVASNVVGSVISVLGWVLACAIYRLLTPADNSLKDVFA